MWGVFVGLHIGREVEECLLWPAVRIRDRNIFSLHYVRGFMLANDAEERW